MTMQASPRCKTLVAEFEGIGEKLPTGQYRAYPDPGSPMARGLYPKNGKDVSKGAPWTIGFGATGAGITRGTVWTLAQCERRLDDDIQRFVAGVNRLLVRYPRAQTTQNQFDALVSFAYNCGLDENRNGRAEGLGDSTLFAKHVAGDYKGAQAEFGKWVNAGGVKLNGLVRRRKAEADLYGS